MKPPKPADRKQYAKYENVNGRRQHRPNRSRCLFTVRSALIIELAVITGLVGAGLLLAAHRSVPLAVLGGCGILAAAIGLYDQLIELSAGPGALRRNRPGSH
jgi:hypothetical protein